MISQDELKNIQILALDAVFNKNRFGSYYDHVCRWYSTTFHTPLTEVIDLPEQFVLKHWFESQYEAILNGEKGEERLEEIKDLLLKTDAEIISEEEEEDQWVRSLEAEIQSENEKKQKAKEPNLYEDLPQEVSVVNSEDTPFFDPNE